MGGACSAYGKEERHLQGFAGETCGKESIWETQTKIIIIIFINCNLVVTRWQWLFYMYTKYEIGY